MADYDAFFLIRADNDRLVINTSIRVADDHLMRAYKVEGVEYVWTGNCLLGIIGKAPIKPALIAELLLGCFGTGRWLIKGDLAREVRDQCYAMRRTQYEKHLHEAYAAADRDNILKYHGFLEDLHRNESIIELV